MSRYKIDSKKKLKLDKKAYDQLRAINTRGNSEIVWASDESVWGLNDHWVLPKEIDGRLMDDCDGFTLWKINELIKAGFPKEPLLFTICTTELGECHAVLCVVTDRGDFILDNRQPDVISYDDIIALGYTFQYRVALGQDLNGLWENIKKYKE